ncbi:MAG TPA: hypothetical protein VL354_10055 [Spirochaetia bacterium]|nr:hypothetical protein [Spirochaetia bacterium]
MKPKTIVLIAGFFILTIASSYAQQHYATKTADGRRIAAGGITGFLYVSGDFGATWTKR